MCCEDYARYSMYGFYGSESAAVVPGGLSGPVSLIGQIMLRHPCAQEREDFFTKVEQTVMSDARDSVLTYADVC
jgi:hypothetical protein